MSKTILLFLFLLLVGPRLSFSEYIYSNEFSCKQISESVNILHKLQDHGNKMVKSCDPINHVFDGKEIDEIGCKFIFTILDLQYENETLKLKDDIYEDTLKVCKATRVDPEENNLIPKSAEIFTQLVEEFKLISLSESKDKILQFNNAEQLAAEKFSKLGKENENDLAKKSPKGSSLLTVSSKQGFYLIVKVLLDFKSVRDDINYIDPSGFSALNYTRTASNQSPLICSPNLFSDLENFSYVSGLSEYFNPYDSPYSKIETLLLKNGASGNKETFKKLFLINCPEISFKNKKMIMKSEDPLKDILKIGHDEYTDFLIKALTDSNPKKTKKKKKKKGFSRQNWSMIHLQ